MSGSGKAAVGAVAVALVLAAALSAGARQGEPKAAPAASASDLAFLEVGKAYMIHFAPGHEITITSTVRMTSGDPEFVVKKLGGGSWALLEYPLDVNAASMRSFARLALTSKEWLAEQEKTAEGRKEIADYKEIAAMQVLTAEAWVNLAHAVVIAPPVVDMNDPRLKASLISVDK